MDLDTNDKHNRLTITKDDATIILKKKEILELMVFCLSWFGWEWLNDKLERYAIYVDM